MRKGLRRPYATIRRAFGSELAPSGLLACHPNVTGAKEAAMPSDPSSVEQNRGRELAMRTQGTLVVASDGSDNSVGALIVARELAHGFGSALELVSVLEPVGIVVPPLRAAPPPLHEGATRVQDRRDRLRVLCERALCDRQPRPTTRMLIGDVPTSIATAAKCHRARLVVTGRVAHGRIERAIRRETPLFRRDR